MFLTFDIFLLSKRDHTAIVTFLYDFV